MLVINPV